MSTDNHYTTPALREAVTQVAVAHLKAQPPPPPVKPIGWDLMSETEQASYTRATNYTPDETAPDTLTATLTEAVTTGTSPTQSQAHKATQRALSDAANIPLNSPALITQLEARLAITHTDLHEALTANL